MDILSELMNESLLLSEAKKVEAKEEKKEAPVKYSADDVAEVTIHKIREDGMYHSSFSDSGDPTIEYVRKVMDGTIAKPTITPEDKKAVNVLFRAYHQPYNNMAVFKKSFVQGTGSIDKSSLEAIVGSIGKTMYHYKLIDTYAEKAQERKEKKAEVDKEISDETGVPMLDRSEVQAIIKGIKENLKKDYFEAEGKLVSFAIESVRTVTVDTSNEFITIKVAGTAKRGKLFMLNIPYNSVDKNFEGDDGKPVRVINKLFEKFPEEKDLLEMKQTKLAESKWDLDKNYKITGLVAGFRCAVKKPDGNYALTRNIEDMNVTALMKMKDNPDDYMGVTIIGVSPNTEKDVDPKQMKINLYNQGVIKLLGAGQYLAEKGDQVKARVGGIRMVGVMKNRDTNETECIVTGKTGDGRWFYTVLNPEHKEAVAKLFKSFPSTEEIEKRDVKVLPDNAYKVNIGNGFSASAVQLRIKYKGDQDIKPINPLSMDYSDLKDLIQGENFFRDCQGITRISLSKRDDEE